MRIIHVLTRLLRAGSEENTLLNCAGQLSAGHEVIVVHGHEATSDHACRLAPGAGFVEIPTLTRALRPARDLRALRQLERVFAEIRPDIVHTHQSKAGILGRFAAVRAGVPKVIHGVHILPFLGETKGKRAIYLRAEQAAARRTDAFIHVSDGMKTACLEHRVGLDRPHHVVRSGFNLHRFAAAEPPEDWRRLLGLSPGEPKPPVVAMLSSLEPRKRHLDLIDRLPSIVGRIPSARFVFGGEGHMHDRIAARIAELDLGRNVIMLGFRDDPERIIALADLCIHCSGREGLPRSVLQYLAGGRPVLMFHLPGIEDVVTHCGNGLVVRPDDWPTLLDRLAGLLADRETLRGLGAGARQTDLGLWDAGRMAAETLRIYASVRPGR